MDGGGNPGGSHGIPRESLTSRPAIISIYSPFGSKQAANLMREEALADDMI